MSARATAWSAVAAYGDAHASAAVAETVTRAGVRPAPTRIAVIGEFNSGKTSLINALLGAPVLPTSFTSHTAYPTVVRYAARPSLAAEVAGRKRVPIAWDRLEEAAPAGICRLHVGMPLAVLKALNVIDTPGLGRNWGGCDGHTLQACRGADAVIWCTPAVQAWKASEERAWLTLPEGLRRRGVLAVTFLDAIGSPGDARRVMARLETEAGAYFRCIVAAPARGAEATGTPLELTGCRQ